MLINISVQWLFFRIDLTQDKRYTLSKESKTVLRSVDKPIEVGILLNGELNSGFALLKSSTEDMLREMGVYARIDIQDLSVDDLHLPDWVHATAVYERDAKGRASETLVYPYLLVRCGENERLVELLDNNRLLSGVENLNNSCENLEYKIIGAIRDIMSNKRKQIVFLEGHHELSERETYDAQQQLAKYFDIYRGSLTDDADCLDEFDAVLVVGPEDEFSEKDKYILDNYIVHGGKVMWVVNGVKFSESVLSDEGFTPIITQEVNLTDLLYRYGVRINNRLVQDAQCLSIPVDVSADRSSPQYEPMPWVYAPLLNPKNDSQITENVSIVSSMFVSDIDFVGKDNEIDKRVLLSTSGNSRLLSAPQEVDLSEIDLQYFIDNSSRNDGYAVAVSLEGQFRSLFEHRMLPVGLSKTSNEREPMASRQVVIASSSIIRNEVQGGDILPMGFDRYTRQQYSNRDFILNAVLWLTDNDNLMQLKSKTLPLRILSRGRVEGSLSMIQIASCILPIALLFLIAIGIHFARKKYIRM